MLVVDVELIHIDRIPGRDLRDGVEHGFRRQPSCFRGRCGRGLRLSCRHRPLRRGSRACESFQGQADISHDRVAHRGTCSLLRIAGHAEDLGSFGQEQARLELVVAKDWRANHEDYVMAIEQPGDGRHSGRQDPAVTRMGGGERTARR